MEEDGKGPEWNLILTLFFYVGIQLIWLSRRPPLYDSHKLGYLELHLRPLVGNPNSKTSTITFIQAFTFLIDKIYMKFCDNFYRQTLGIPMGTDCASLLADIYLYTYE